MYEGIMYVRCGKCGKELPVSRSVYAYSPDRRCICSDCIEKMTLEEREEFEREGERQRKYNKGPVLI